jgi:hypothetical protein
MKDIVKSVLGGEQGGHFEGSDSDNCQFTALEGRIGNASRN